MDLTVITATCDRPKHLARTLQAVADQRCPLTVEHIVVHDGPGPRSRFLANLFGARYFETEGLGHWGAGCKDLGIREARGEYVVFWDDDNSYEPWALTALYVAAHGHDIGIVRCLWVGLEKEIVRVLPPTRDDDFAEGDVDTICLCVRRDLASRVSWYDMGEARGEDFRWLEAVRALGPRLNYVPVVVGKHL
jgi:GT2 family glycosyltransferase